MAWAEFFRAIPSVDNPYSLAAFATAVVFLIVALAIGGNRRRKVPLGVWLVVVAVVLLGVIGPVVSEIIRDQSQSRAIYRVRVIVKSPQGVPVEDARVWSSLGGELKKVAGGWEFDIPAALKPAHGHVSVFAERPSAFLTGQSTVTLGEDHNVSITLQLHKDASAPIRGNVVDPGGRAITGALVSVVGYGGEVVTTDEVGSFELLAHAATGEQVQLYAEKEGLGVARQWHPAGDEPVTLVLRLP